MYGRTQDTQTVRLMRSPAVTSPRPPMTAPTLFQMQNTEAGEGEDGRMKSAIGIGALLMDGLGDTIRVSLTEDPEYEIDPCKRLASLGETAWTNVGVGKFWLWGECGVRKCGAGGGPWTLDLGRDLPLQAPRQPGRDRLDQRGCGRSVGWESVEWDGFLQAPVASLGENAWTNVGVGEVWGGRRDVGKVVVTPCTCKHARLPGATRVWACVGLLEGHVGTAVPNVHTHCDTCIFTFLGLGRACL